MPNTYSLNQLVHLVFPFTVNGVPTDPTAITLKVKDPTGAETTYTLSSTPPIARDSAGNYHLDITVNLAGTWSYHCEGTGTAQASDDEQFYVRPPVA